MTAQGEAPATIRDLQALALVNYGHFTSMRVEEGAVKGLDLHMKRLTLDARTLFGVELDTRAVRAEVRRTLAGQPDQPHDVRVTVYDPDINLGRPADSSAPTFLVTYRPARPARAALAPLRLQSVQYTRDAPEIKHVGLFGTIKLRREAQVQGYDDVLFVDAKDRISEGATWNVGFYDHPQIVWPDAPCLGGVTMALLQRSAHEHARRTVTLTEMSNLPVAFATNASIGVRAVASIDDVRFDTSHPVLAALQAQYNSVRGDQL